MALKGLEMPETGPTCLARVRLLPSVNEDVGTEVSHLRGQSQGWGQCLAPPLLTRACHCPLEVMGEGGSNSQGH